MATREQFQLSQQERRRRVFSEDFKRSKVREIERGQTTTAEVSRQYQVRYNNVVKWIKKYGTLSREGVRLIVETESDTRKIIDLQARIAELERIIGQKQLLIEFQDKMISLAEEAYGVDIKKKFETEPCSIIGSTGKSSTAV